MNERTNERTNTLKKSVRRKRYVHSVIFYTNIVYVAYVVLHAIYVQVLNVTYSTND